MSESKPAMIGSNYVLDQLETALVKERPEEALQAFVRILRGSSSAYTWVGVYIVKGNNLVLGEYEGDAETEHVSIPIGHGICGAAAKEGMTVNVPDVSRDPRYLMCFPSTRSEIVVPIKGSRGVLGEIDIDSDRLSAFSSWDQRFLEKAANLLAAFLEKD